jgi:hypothetical protein
MKTRGMAIAVPVVVALGVLGFVGWRLLMRSFTDQYYRESYAPFVLVEGDAGTFPAGHHLADVPWISADIQACQSVTLQIIAAQLRIIAPRRHFEFLMAFTYGASEIPGTEGFFPAGADPEVGMREAAPYLGLSRRYYVTDDPALYLDGIRSWLVRGYPVRVGVEMGVLYGAPGSSPHSELLAGYDPGSFYFYETVCLPPATCQPGERPAGERGLYVPNERLLDAVARQARQFQYPWRYSFAVFEPGPRATDLNPVWARLAQATVGGIRYGPRTGADVFERAAATIEELGARYDPADFRVALAAERFRQDNGRYLRETFPGEADLVLAADLFDQAAAAHRQALADGNDSARAAAALREAATLKREIGDIFESRSR